MSLLSFSFFFFFNDTATTEIYTLSLHDALPICVDGGCRTDAPLGQIDCHGRWALRCNLASRRGTCTACLRTKRSEEHTSEIQSQSNLVCRLLLEKKKKIK